MSAVKGYDAIKHKALEPHDNIYNDYNHIKHKLFKIFRNIYFKCKDNIVSKKNSIVLYIVWNITLIQLKII